MDHINVAEWSPEQVADWLRGLEDVIHPYIHSFIHKKVNGKRLLYFGPSDLLALNIKCIGHQEIILQGIELLCNLHYYLQQENLQSLALNVSSKTRSIYNDLRKAAELEWQREVTSWNSIDERIKYAEEAAKSSHKNERVSTKILAGVADALSSVKILVSWLHRSPFFGIDEYDNVKSELVENSISLATIAQRDAFAEKQASVIKDSCLTLAQIADKIIQDSTDPMILQPSPLEIAKIRKRSDDNLGISLASTYEGVHQIASVRTHSRAKKSGKVMPGDQIVQVNFQTVIGWTSLKVTQAIEENPKEVTLTLKKCPRHITNPSMLYFRPIRLPSKKRAYSPWEGFSPMPNYRFELQALPTLPVMKDLDETTDEIPRRPETPIRDTPSPLLNKSVSPAHSFSSGESEISGGTRSDVEEIEYSDDAFISDSDAGAPSAYSVRLFQPKPITSIKRRATLPGGTVYPSESFDDILKEYCKVKRGSHDPDADLRHLANPHIHITRPHTYHSEKDKPVDVITKSKSLEQSDMPYIDDSDSRDLDPMDSGKDTGLSDGASSLCGTTRETSQSPRDLSTHHPRLDKTTSSPAYSDEPSIVNRSIESDGSFHSDSRSFNISSQTDSSLDNSKLIKSPIDSDRSSLRSSDISDGSFCAREANTVTEISPDTSYGAMNRNYSAIPAKALQQEPHLRGNPSSQPQSIVQPPDSSPCYANIEPRNNSKVTPHIVVNPLQMASEKVSETVGRTADFFSAANRRISCRELGQGDQQGWLYQRREGKGFLSSHRWVKRWFILMKNILYGYQNKDALTASSLVFLPGFHVAPAADVKSKRYAFKIFHASGATFYFSCDTAEERSRWMSQMGLSAISTINRQAPGNVSDDPYFSETDEEIEDKGSHKSPFAIRKDTPTSKGTPITPQQPPKISGLKFLQPPKKALGQPVPTPNFRSYVRVREGQNPEAGKPPKTPLSETKEKDSAKDVKRKNSFRERFKQFPVSLTMDRKKNKSNNPLSPKRFCTSSKSETSLVDKRVINPNVAHSQSNIHLQNVQSLQLAESMPKTNGQRDSPVYARRKSFEALRAQISSSPGSRQGICSVNNASSDEELVEENWDNSLRSVPTKSRVPPKFVAKDMTGSTSEPQLKKAQQYFPVSLGRDRKEPMQPAFELSLSSSEQSLANPRNVLDRKTSMNSGELETPKRPQVPPRTKFFSPKELELSHEYKFSEANAGGYSYSTPKTSKGSAPPNLVISPSTDDGDSPRTPQMPAMGISMIGKPRRTSNALSPREILPHYPGMEYPPTFEPESYSLNFLPEKQSPTETRKRSPPHTRPPSSSSFGSSPSNGSYINVGLVPNTLEESHNRSYHHQIYVTSPHHSECLSRSRLSNRSLGSHDSRQSAPSPARMSSNHSNSMSSFRTSPTESSSSHSSSYLPMTAQPTSEYINMSLPRRRGFDPKKGHK